MSNHIYTQSLPLSTGNICQYSGCGKLTKNPRFCNLTCCSRDACEKKIQNKPARIAAQQAEYLLNPKLCLNCNEAMPFKYHKEKKFCGSSCAATYTNKSRTLESRKKQQTTIQAKYDLIPKKARLSKNRPMEDNIKGIYPYTPIIWKKCDITGKYYHNKTSEGSQRKSSPYAKDIKKIYYYLSKFKFNVNLMPELFDLPLIEQYGWYVCRDPVRPQLIQNTGGVSRDHRYSIAQGIIDKVHPLILSHPANCSIVLHKDNKRKLVGCDITVAELVKQILYFDNAKQNFKNHQIILDLIYNDQIFLVDFDILRKLV